jgi:hypothetical protein
MKSLDDLPLNEAIEMYYEKHHAVKIGDLDKLRELKGKCPDLFDAKKENSLRELIEYAKKFANTSRYKELRRQDVKNKLSIIRNEISKDEDSS